MSHTVSAQRGTLVAHSSVRYVAAGAVVLLSVLAGLFYYKWGAALRAVNGVLVSGEWRMPPDGLTAGGVLRASWFYLRRVWLALAYGLLIGAIVRTFTPVHRIVAMAESRGPWRGQVAAGVAAAPLMLCSCCITPVFTSAYERGARLTTALAVMLGSPGLNPAALVLTFLLFPRAIALSRLGAALAAVLVLPLVVQHATGVTHQRLVTQGGRTDDPPPATTARELLVEFVRSVGHLLVVTVPLALAGTVLSSLIVPASVALPAGGRSAAVMLTGAVATLIALPTFFELPIALVLLRLGAPGAAVAVLVAGPLINLPSLLILAREAGARVAVALAIGVWSLAVGAGVLTS